MSRERRIQAQAADHRAAVDAGMTLSTSTAAGALARGET